MPDDTFKLAVAIHELQARYQVMSIALQEALRVLSPEQAGQCAKAICDRARSIADSEAVALLPPVDEAISSELAAFLSALRSPGKA